MGTRIRAELSEKNKYWISRHRYYELKHFCLQYPYWRRTYAALDDLTIYYPQYLERISSTNIPGDPTAKWGMARAYYSERIELVERIAAETDKALSYYILKAVTEDLSYNYLNSKLDMPCGKDMYYDRYRKFFWLLSLER